MRGAVVSSDWLSTRDLDPDSDEAENQVQGHEISRDLAPPDSHLRHLSPNRILDGLVSANDFVRVIDSHFHRIVSTVHNSIS